MEKNGNWVRSPEIIKAHDKAVTYVINWWEQKKGRSLVSNLTADPFGPDLYNDIEYVHVNYRTDEGKWKTGPFPFPSLRELTHKIRKYKELENKTGKIVYITHVSNDYSRIIISKVNDFDLSSEKVEMPSETKTRGFVTRYVCYSNIFFESPLPYKKFKIIQKQTKLDKIGKSFYLK